MKNLQSYSRYLAQFYPESQRLKIGLDKLYAYENSKGRVIDNVELLGLLAYNRAYMAREKGRFARAYDLILIAQLFNADSRSNENFEINLYYDWGKKLYDKNRHEEAFQVFADAVFRYSNVKNFQKNCLSVFFKAMRQFWTKRQWEKSHWIIEDLLALEIMGDKEKQSLIRILYTWATYGSHTKNEQLFKEVVEVMKRVDPDIRVQVK
jgi:hypothetical protein